MFRWSYTALGDYERCPAMYRYKHVDRLPEVKGPALDRGNAIHKQIEDYLLGRVAELPAAFDRFKDYIDGVKARPNLQVEGKWALSRDWKIVDWKADNAWWRGKADAYYRDGKRATIVDWKTGKIYDSNRDQMRLYAGVVLSREPEVDEVTVDLIYLDAREGRDEHYTRDHLAPIVHDFNRRTARIEADEKFNPKPGHPCKWCSYSKSKGGPCSAG